MTLFGTILTTKDLLDAKPNVSAVVAPTANDDNTLGYAIGSVWVDTVAVAIYQCADASTGAAVWKKLFSLGALQTYTVSNVSPDRAYDANATSVDELADVLGTLIADLKSQGLIA